MGPESNMRHESAVEARVLLLHIRLISRNFQLISPQFIVEGVTSRLNRAEIKNLLLVHVIVT